MPELTGRVQHGVMDHQEPFRLQIHLLIDLVQRFFNRHGKLELTGAPGPETNGASNSRKHRGSWRQLAISIKCFRLQHYCDGALRLYSSSCCSPLMLQSSKPVSEEYEDCFYKSGAQSRGSAHAGAPYGACSPSGAWWNTPSSQRKDHNNIHF